MNWASTYCWRERRRRLRCRPARPCSRRHRRLWPRRRPRRIAAIIFDFVEFQKNAEQSMTPEHTPSIPHIYALGSKLDEFFAEGLDARFARHQKTNQLTPGLGGEARTSRCSRRSGFESVTLTCVNNGAKPGGRTQWTLAKLQKSGQRPGLPDRWRLRQDQGHHVPVSPTWATKPRPP